MLKATARRAKDPVWRVPADARVLESRRRATSAAVEPDPVVKTLSTELTGWIDRADGPARLYADANVPAGLVAFMRQTLRWDVFWVMEHDDLRRAPDVEHYRLAHQMHRTLITLDHDYLDDQRFPPRQSGGVIVLSAPDEQQAARLLRRLDGRVFGSGREAPRAPLLGRKVVVQPEIADAVGRRRRRRRR